MKAYTNNSFFKIINYYTDSNRFALGESSGNLCGFVAIAMYDNKSSCRNPERWSKHLYKISCPL